CQVYDSSANVLF
nr:immunoglobulin light chain junction region [Macaca mulatta]MPO03051.1 immunoglobulin light chain junction region [Macaca mulatta]MPO03096.1 immunoglobulin light chain junction region [Macaca mulatta]MPO03102.1 immunoglobulin light chain junction region [Macaca mulatta]MPO03113.1 immunoglobulin light chain junction region [Macaca mulatta]